MNKKIKLIIYALILAVILFFIGVIIGFTAYNIFSVNNTPNTISNANNNTNVSTSSISTNTISSNTQQSSNTVNVNTSISPSENTTNDNTNTASDNTSTASQNIVSTKTYRANATINSNKANLYYNPNSNSEIIPGGEYLGHGRQIEVLQQNVDGTNYDEVIVTISSVPYKGYVYSDWITLGLNN